VQRRRRLRGYEDLREDVRRDINEPGGGEVEEKRRRVNLRGELWTR
jgi:hypothetical protein